MLTQVGGLIYLLALLTNRYLDKKVKLKPLNLLSRLSVFIVLYLATTFLLVPVLAKPLGRVPLPMREDRHLKPLTFLTCLLNRHYVRLQMRDAAYDIAGKMADKYPGTTVNYLDANFPFINGFPLLPHWSHNDGKKLDLAFCYIDVATGAETNLHPSFIGYGICEEPRPGEVNTAEMCNERGYWNYSMLKVIMPQGSKADFVFDSARTATLTNLFAVDERIGKIFIEPHLIARLKLASPKLRFHGCHAVRHDDHLHVQLK